MITETNISWLNDIGWRVVDHKILDWSIFKQITEDILKCI